MPRNFGSPYPRDDDMILHPAAWTILLIGAVIIVWFTMRDDEPPE